ncbi:transcript variant X2 [Nothobranchius furzeri]|uniref:Transcript variant X2 n=1 Tax=Nothobranchius furzeri TaxID=105023 RepID=A0A9D2YKQ8_NOTFU|nr:transcript variant X2 [Nothobranchius furzeri]
MGFFVRYLLIIIGILHSCEATTEPPVIPLPMTTTQTTSDATSPSGGFQIPDSTSEQTTEPPVIPLPMTTTHRPPAHGTSPSGGFQPSKLNIQVPSCALPFPMCCPGRNDACRRVSCYCDQYCLQNNDCCSDYVSTCTATITSAPTVTLPEGSTWQSDNTTTSSTASTTRTTSDATPPSGGFRISNSTSEAPRMTSAATTYSPDTRPVRVFLNAHILSSYNEDEVFKAFSDYVSRVLQQSCRGCTVSLGLIRTP